MENISFSDISIEEQYSDILSRKEINIGSDMGNFYMNLPVVSSNMPQITETSMAVCMYKNGGRGILHRFCSIEDNVAMFKDAMRKLNISDPYAIGVSIGVQKEDKERFIQLYNAGARFFCIDVAHGHHVLVKDMIQWIKRKKHQDISLMAGNIATASAASDLAEWGADIVKVGIGPGCFTAETKINTPKGLRDIKDVKKGETVLTHRGNYKKVLNTVVRREKEFLIEINKNIKCTKNHEFYVLHKKYKLIVTDKNINEYAEWISAGDLTKNYFLLQVNK